MALTLLDIAIRQTWDGRPCEPAEVVGVRLELGREALDVFVEAPSFDDPAPEAPPGALWGLWGFEVVEVFLLGDSARYLEVELGPHGHHLILSLEGRRQIVGRHEPLSCHVTRHDGRWSGHLRLARSLLPETLRAFNAYAIHGLGDARRYLAAHPVPGDQPDFHRLEHFAPWPHDPA